MRLRYLCIALVVGLLVGSMAQAHAQGGGPSPAVVQAALRGFLAQAQTFSSTVTATSFKTSTALVATGGGGSTGAFTAASVGGTGQPTTAAQNGWLKMTDSTGATIWVPVWK